MVALKDPNRYIFPDKKPEPAYRRTSLLEELAQLEKRIIGVPKSSLPGRIAGYCKSTKESGAYGDDFQQFMSEYVRIHEIGHILGADGSPAGERQTNAIAMERTGRPELNPQGPCYNPPINLN